MNEFWLTVNGVPGVVRLDQLDETEWWDACWRVCPDVMRAEFDLQWHEF